MASYRCLAFQKSKAGGDKNAEILLFANWYYFPDSDLGISFSTRQSDNQLLISIQGISKGEDAYGYNNSEERPTFRRLMKEARLSWRAARLSDGNCVAHAFEQHARYGQSYSGNFPSPDMRSLTTNNYVDLTPEDHGHAFCIQIKGDGRYIYISSPLIIKKGPQGSIKQQAGFLAYEKDALDQYWSGFNIEFVKIDKATFNRFHYNQASGIGPTGCGPAFFNHSYQMLQIQLGNASFVMINLLKLSEEDIGSRYCFKISGTASGKLLTSYVLSHEIVNPSGNWPSFAHLEERLPKQLDLEMLRKILRDQLTPRGQLLLDELDIQITTFESEYIGGQFSSYAKYGLWGALLNIEDTTVYLSSSLLPDDYAQLDSRSKLFYTKIALQTLAHEFMHYADYVDGFHNVQEGCEKSIQVKYASDESFHPHLRRWSEFIYNDSEKHWNEAVINNDADLESYWLFWEEYNECLTADPARGRLYESLRNFLLQRDRFYEGQDFLTGPRYWTQVFNDIEVKWSTSYYSVNSGSAGWYKESYADFPTIMPWLPPVLEEHYSQFWQDRSSFVDNFYQEDGLWEWD